MALALTLSWHVYINAKAASEEGWRRTALAAAGEESTIILNGIGTADVVAVPRNATAATAPSGSALSSRLSRTIAP